MTERKAEAPFSEPREWARCGECMGDRGNFVARFWQEEEEALASCPKCGQPPRCETGAAADHRCPRPATGKYGGGLLCGQHLRSHDIFYDLDEWGIAREQMKHFCGLAKSWGNFALVDAMDLAWAECEMRISTLEAEQAMVWEDGTS